MINAARKTRTLRKRTPPILRPHCPALGAGPRLHLELRVNIYLYGPQLRPQVLDEVELQVSGPSIARQRPVSASHADRAEAETAVARDDPNARRDLAHHAALLVRTPHEARRLHEAVAQPPPGLLIGAGVGEALCQDHGHRAAAFPRGADEKRVTLEMPHTRRVEYDLFITQKSD
jgi:hypothetical protein